MTTNSQAVVPFHQFLFKVASRCNLNCDYCFVYNLGDEEWKRQPKLMSPAVASAAARRILEHCRAHNKEDISIVFHGGEPLMGGPRHISALLEAIDEVLVPEGLEYSVGIQSNGVLFNPDFGDLMLRRGKMSIGISLDGPPSFNDRHRVDHRGAGSGLRVEKGLRLLTSDKYRTLFSGFLAVVDLEQPPEVLLEYLFKFDPPSVDLLLPLNNHSSFPKGKKSLASREYGEWLTRAFDFWVASGSQASIRRFETIIALLCGRPSALESHGLTPVDLVVVETNGDIDGVDALKSAYDGATKLGFNVLSHSFDDVAEHAAVRSRQLGAEGLPIVCKSCDLQQVCGGGYLPHRYSDEWMFNGPGVYCYDYQQEIRHIHRFLITNVLSQQRAAA